MKTSLNSITVSEIEKKNLLYIRPKFHTPTSHMASPPLNRFIRDPGNFVAGGLKCQLFPIKQSCWCRVEKVDKAFWAEKRENFA